VSASSDESKPVLPAPDPAHVQSVRVPGQLRVRVDALVQAFRARPPGFSHSRSSVLLKIIEAGLDALEREYLPPGTSGPQRTRADLPLARTRGDGKGMETSRKRRRA